MTDGIPARMTAVLLTAHGGIDALQYREDIPTPTPGGGEVLIRVAAAGVNNTDINARIGWYSREGEAGTGGRRRARLHDADSHSAAWFRAHMAFPRIQGADCCGRIVAAGDGVSSGRIGERVIVRTMLRSPVRYRPFAYWTFGLDCDGVFAEYAKAPSAETYTVNCGWTDAELGTVPCAYSTAENMLHRASVTAERVVVTGASGGVGAAAVQLAKRRGAHVVAVASAPKADDVLALLRRHRTHQLEERLATGARWRESGLVFTTSIGTAIDKSRLLKDFKAILRAAGLPNIRYHDLRHTARDGCCWLRGWMVMRHVNADEVWSRLDDGIRRLTIDPEWRDVTRDVDTPDGADGGNWRRANTKAEGRRTAARRVAQQEGTETRRLTNQYEDAPLKLASEQEDPSPTRPKRCVMRERESGPTTPRNRRA